MYMVNERIIKSDESIPIKAHFNSSDIDVISSDSHFHGEIELGYICEGSMIFLSEGEEFEAKKGSLVIFNSMTEHTTKADGYVSIILVQFRTNLFSQFCNKKWGYFEDFFSQDFKYLIVETNDNPALSQIPELLYSTVEEINDKKTAYEFSIVSNLLKIFTLIFRNVTVPAQSDIVNTRKNNEILTYITENYDQDLKLHEVAQRFHFSASYFGHLFKDLTGVSFVKYLNNYRITISKKLLMNPKNTITGAMVQAGFSNRSYFNRLFKQYVGCSPQEYRNKFLESQTSRKH